MLLFFLLVGRYLDLAMRRTGCSPAISRASAEFAHRLDAGGELVRFRPPPFRATGCWWRG
jgi:hypothetical protein